LFSFFLRFHSKAINTLSELDQWRIEKTTIPASLLKKITHTESSFRVAIDQSPITRVHTWRDALRLPRLVASHEITIEYFEYKCAKVISIDRR
jgi:hypothetical protein